MSLLLALLAQIGPFPGIGATPVSPLPPEDQQHQARERAKRAQENSSLPIPDADSQQGAPVQTGSATSAAAAAQARRAEAPDPNSKLGACLGMISEDPGAAADAAQDWLKQSKGTERAQAGQCLGSARAAQQDFGNARTAFIAARDAAAPADHLGRARLGAMAGSAALAENDSPGALALLDVARSDAGAANQPKLVSGVATDRARALVALKRDPEAATALADARGADPANPEAWLLSATLSRRMNRLADAQAQIEQAAKLLPVDPEIGLEAGVIAVLSGHDEAARKSWQSVVAMAPQSDEAARAKGYLAQLDPPPGGTSVALPASTPASGR
jgi:tetratricopeptide (TPR) repeat protein